MEPLWKPDPKAREKTQMGAFMDYVEKKGEGHFASYDDFYRWSIQKTELFWDYFWDFAGIIGHKKGPVKLKKGPFYQRSFFPESRLNYAENLLNPKATGAAIHFWGEESVKRKITHEELRHKVACYARSLQRMGVQKGDRVVGFMPNMPETLMAMLATASIGAIWASCSPDFGVQGALDRFGQLDPKVMFFVDGYFYKGKAHDVSDKARQILAQLPSSPASIMVPYAGGSVPSRKIPRCYHSEDILDEKTPPPSLSFVEVPFNHPLMVLFSSGTTGKPKCLVHGHGGTLIQHLKEHRLHSDLHPKDVFFYYTTTGWMMWNWLVSGLASDATLVMYDGSPFYPKPDILLTMIEHLKATHFGVSAKYIEALAKESMTPKKNHDLSALRMIFSTGSPLSDSSFRYVYKNIKEDLCLASISGGTDIVSCFALGNPMGPVYSEQLQTPGLAMDVAVLDSKGQEVMDEKGELVCRQPFPSMPVCFWGDSDNRLYEKSYFRKFEGIWHHGDFVKRTYQGGVIFYGRSDTVLNPGGVRIGTAEIYRQVEKVPEVLESVVIGQPWRGDVRVLLFVVLSEGAVLTQTLKEKIKATIRRETTPRHVPADIIAVPDIPKTISGKIMEKSVSDIIHGRRVENMTALSNPKSLSYFKALNLDTLSTSNTKSHK